MTNGVPVCPLHPLLRHLAVLELRARVARKYDVVTEPVPVGPLRVWFSRVADPEAVLDHICARIDRYERETGRRVQGDQLGLPYWAELWDSAAGLGAWLVKGGPLEGRRVLDLGCGLGLAGTVAAMLRADVLFGDLETDCLLFARLNGWRYSGRVEARRVDWQRDDLGRRFDLILGSDVLYDRSQWPFLDAFFRRHLAPGGRVLLGEPGRQSGDDYLDWVAGRGWTLKRQEQPVPTRTTPIRLFELTGVAR